MGSKTVKQEYMVKQGDIVTVRPDGPTKAANTYIVHRKLEGEVLLTHPLAPNSFILRKDEELDNANPTPKGNIEYQLGYGRKFYEYLNFDNKSELDALCMYFVAHRKLSDSQKRSLSVICGRIAKVYCENDLSVASRLVNEHLPLLDDFNERWYHKLKKVFDGSEKSIKPETREAVFRIAGFILSQVHREV